MAIYDDIRREFEQFHHKSSEDMRGALTFIEGFTEGFREYIGAPYAFEVKGTGDAAPQRYVEALPAVQMPGGDIKVEKPRHPQDHSRKQPNGEWLSVIRVILETAPNTGPKRPWASPVRFKIQGQEAIVTLGPEGRTFRLSKDDAAGFRPAYNMLVELIKTALSLEHWDPADVATDQFSGDPTVVN